jgi:hypothetical protein
MLKASLQRPMDEPGMFIFDGCCQFIRTLPVLQRDPKKTDDVDTRSEDHIFDSVKYRCLNKRHVSRVIQSWG